MSKLFFQMIAISRIAKSSAKNELVQGFLRKILSLIFCRQYQTCLQCCFTEMVEDMLVPLVALGVEYYNGPVVTILASKTSRKCLAALSVTYLLRFLFARLLKMFSKRSRKKCFCIFIERYRVQCDKFEGLWLVVHELVMRLKDHFADLKDGVPLRLSFMGPLPLQYYFELIDNHFEVRPNSCLEQ